MLYQPISPPSPNTHITHTHTQGMFVLGRIRELVHNYVEKSQLTSTPEGLQGLVAHYQAKFADLYLAIQPDAPGTAQDKAAAARRLQQAIADDVWDGRK